MSLKSLIILGLFGWTSLFSNPVFANAVERHHQNLIKKYDQLGLINRQFENEDYHINYFDSDKGVPLVLLHGFGADGAVTWQKQVRKLLPKYRIIIPDLCWFGGSYSNKERTLETQISGIHSLLDSLGISQYNIAGISYGGFVAFGLVNAFPEQIRKLVIISSPGHTFDKTELNRLSDSLNINNVSELFVPQTPSEVYRLLNITTKKHLFIPQWVLKQIQEVYFSKYHQDQKQLLKNLQNLDLSSINEKEIKKVKSLIIWGENDVIFRKKEGIKFATAIDAQFTSIKNASHVVTMEKTRKFNQIFLDFLDEN